MKMERVTGSRDHLAIFSCVDWAGPSPVPLGYSYSLATETGRIPYTDFTYEYYLEPSWELKDDEFDEPTCLTTFIAPGGRQISQMTITLIPSRNLSAIQKQRLHILVRKTGEYIRY